MTVAELEACNAIKKMAHTMDKINESMENLIQRLDTMISLYEDGRRDSRNTKTE